MNMDCFIDEVKNGGTVTSLGVLFMEAGVTEGLDGLLNRPIAKRIGTGATIGEIHWSGMGDIEADIAKEWLTSFLQGPMIFFVHAHSLPGESKADTLKRLIVSLESDPQLASFSRASTTVHFDTDSADPTDLLRDLRRNFGLLRAFKWNSKGSRLLQLCDLLLGIASYLSRPTSPTSGQTLSKGEIRRQALAAQVKDEARRFASHQKVNAILVLDTSGLHYLLNEQMPGQAASSETQQ